MGRILGRKKVLASAPANSVPRAKKPMQKSPVRLAAAYEFHAGCSSGVSYPGDTSPGHMGNTPGHEAIMPTRVHSGPGGLTLDCLFWGWPFATLSADHHALKLSCFGRHYIFPRSSLVRLSRQRGLLGVGLRIEHTERSYPQWVVFWPFSFLWGSGFHKLKPKLESVGYTIVAS